MTFALFPGRGCDILVQLHDEAEKGKKLSQSDFISTQLGVLGSQGLSQGSGTTGQPAVVDLNSSKIEKYNFAIVNIPICLQCQTGKG